MGEKKFEELVNRYLSGRSKKNEADLIKKWLDDRREKDPFSKLSAVEKEKIRVRIFEDLSTKMMKPVQP